MAPKDSSTRFHPYDINKKPKIHRTSNTDADNDDDMSNTRKKFKTNSYSSNNNKNKNKNNATPLQKSSISTSGTGLSINDLKRRIRDVKRLLSRSQLSPEARIVQERALKGYERDLKEEQERRQRSEMIKKYHFVRFLDRKTATKELRIIQLQYEKIKEEESGDKANTKKLATLHKQIDMARINVNYTIYYPLTEKYISLYPQNKKRQSSEDEDEDQPIAADEEDSEMQSTEHDETGKRVTSTTEKPPMWHIIKKCMADKTLEKLRDGKLNIGFDGQPIPSLDGQSGPVTDGGVTNDNDGGKEKKKNDTKADKQQKERKRKQVEIEEEQKDEDGDSDGGFFEE